MLARPTRRAVSLVEVLIASTVLIIMAVPMIGMFTVGNQFSTAGERELRATLLAHELLERTRAELDHRAEQEARTIGLPRVTVNAPEGFRMQIETEVVETDLHRLTVAVYWSDGRRSREVKLSSLASLRPAQQVRMLSRSPGAGYPAFPGGTSGWSR